MSLCSKPKLITFWCRYCNNSYFSNYCWILYIFFHLIIEAIFLQHFYHSLVLQVFSMICFLQPSLVYYFEDFMIKCCLCVYQIISTSCISYNFTAFCYSYVVQIHKTKWTSLVHFCANMKEIATNQKLFKKTCVIITSFVLCTVFFLSIGFFYSQ